MKRITTMAALTVVAAALAATIGAPAANAAPRHVQPHCWIQGTLCVR